MKRNVMKKLCLLFALLPMLWGCGDRLMDAAHHHQAAEQGNVRVQVGPQVQGLEAPSRTVAPSHIPYSQWSDPAQFTLEMTGSSDMGGSVRVSPFTVRNGLGILLLEPGAWELTLTATRVATGRVELMGEAFLIVQGAPTSCTIDLGPVDSATGTVSVQFTLPQSVVKRLDPQTNNSKTVTVALYDEAGQVVASSQQTFTANATTTSSTITYNANGAVAAGKYTLKLTAPYTVNNASTGNADRTHTLGWQDVLYVEGNRQSSASVTLPEGATGVPGRPYRKDKYYGSGSSAGVNFASTDNFNPWGETLWLYGSAWDGTGNDTNGNEILVVDWDPVFDADYYDLEILVHPFTKDTSGPSANGKFSRVVTTDAAWETLRNTNFTYGGQTLKPTYLVYTGGVGRTGYYKTAYYTINCNTNNQFLSCADKTLARSLFPNKGAAVGKVNARYTISAATDAFDNYGTYAYQGSNRGKVGMEGDCGVIGVLLPAFTPQMSLVYRLRAVNQFGHSDWVYWKGGKW